MQVQKRALWLFLILLAALAVVANPSAFAPTGFLAIRAPLIQVTGFLAVGSMCAAIVLSLRPRWAEKRLGGLDKAYRLHRSLGIAALVFAISHWIVTQAPGWLQALGVRLERHGPGTPPHVMGELEHLLRTQRSFAENLGQWSFYVAVLLIAIALLTRIPYRLFYVTHRLAPIVFLALVFHTVILFKFTNWVTPSGAVLALLLSAGTAGAILSLFGRIGAGRKTPARLTSFQYYPELRVLEGELEAEGHWPGHQAGQFAFVKAGRFDEHRPFTIASAWDPAKRRLRFIAKELGDFTSTLKDRARVGGRVTIEGPYGVFNFDDERPIQIWIGGGIGITPFLARLHELARHPQPHRKIFLFHTTSDYSEEAIAKLRDDADAAKVALTVLVDARDGYLTGDRIRATVPGWASASIWFCGPAGFGSSVLRDFVAHGFDRGHFHQELFAWR